MAIVLVTLMAVAFGLIPAGTRALWGSGGSQGSVSLQRPNRLAVGSHVASPRDMRFLVIAADGRDHELGPLRAALDQVGTPYDMLLAAQNPLTEEALWDGDDRGFYQGIFLASGNLTYVDPATGEALSALTEAQWQLLWAYEAAFGVREVSALTDPDRSPANEGLRGVGQQDISAKPLALTLTEAGRAVFATVRPTATINAFVPPSSDASTPPAYLAVTDSPDVTPLLVTADNHVVASVKRHEDGRETLTLTLPNHPNVVHTMLLGHGLVEWAGRGIHLGERHANLGIQVDDLLAQSAVWDVAAGSFRTGLAYRMTGDDFRAATAWQERVRAGVPNAAGLTLELAFNGRGGTGIFSADTLLPAVRTGEGAFFWVNHTFSHQNLNAITYEQARDEIARNDEYARSQLGLTRYSSDTLVQPDISGLTNPDFLRAARDFGIRYLISDTSQPGWDNPTFNTGFRMPDAPEILVVPRRPTGVYAYTSTPEEFVSQYNSIYGPSGSSPFWPKDLTYAEILDKEADLTLRYLLKGDLDPLMFHQTNLRAYDGSRSVLGDLVEATLAKYDAVCALPIRNLTQREAGQQMELRMAFDAARPKATIVPGRSITVNVTEAGWVPVTGLLWGGTREFYGNRGISYLWVEPGRPLTVELSD